MNATNPNDWGPCPTGEWQRLAAGLSFRRWLLFLRNAAVGLIAAAALTGGAWVATAKLTDRPPEHHCCPTVAPAPCGEPKLDCPGVVPPGQPCESKK